MVYCIGLICSKNMYSYSEVIIAFLFMVMLYAFCSEKSSTFLCLCHCSDCRPHPTSLQCHYTPSKLSTRAQISNFFNITTRIFLSAIIMHRWEFSYFSRSIALSALLYTCCMAGVAFLKTHTHTHKKVNNKIIVTLTDTSPRNLHTHSMLTV